MAKKRKRRASSAATKARLKALRRKFGLGEFRSAGSGPRSKEVGKRRRRAYARRSRRTSGPVGPKPGSVGSAFPLYFVR